MNEWLPFVGIGVVGVIFVVVELKIKAPRNRRLKKLEREILDGQ